MAQKIITQTVDVRRQDGRDVILFPDVLAVKGDNKAHLWRVELTDNGAPIDLTGQTAICTVVNGGNTVTLNASISGNVASIEFNSYCYAHTGTMRCMMSVAASGQSPTVAMLCLRVKDGGTDVVIDPDDIIPSLPALLALIDDLADAATAEAARISAESARASAETSRANAESARASAELLRASAEQTRGSNESTRQSQESTRQTKEGERQTAETGRASAEQTRSSNESTRQTQEGTRQSNETARNTKLQNLAFTVEMIAPSGNPHADVTQDSDSIDVKLYVPTSNLAYATFEIDTEGDLIMIAPDGFDDIDFEITDDDQLAVVIE